MRHSQLFDLLDEAGLSPERAAKRLGVSHMTLRRWQALPGATELSPMYERAFKPVFDQMAAEGLIGRASPAARSSAVDQKNSFQAVLKNLGFPENFLEAGFHDKNKMIDGLSRVGEDEVRKKSVDRSKKKISGFVSFGQEWKERINGMLKVIRSKDLAAADKLVAYGALFYLISPIDLIPDNIPVIGYLDDFFFLGLALWFYQERFPRLFAKR